MKFKDLQAMTPQELQEKLKEIQLELIKSGSGSTGTNAKSVGQVNEIKKTIARIKTILKTMEAQIKA